MTTSELQLFWPEWEIVRPLGEGAFGKVYEIRREGDGFEERAALKVIRIPQSESEVKYLRSEGADDGSISAHYKELAGQLSNEIATQARLKGNSNIVSYEDRKVVPNEDGVGYTILIRMELLTSLLDHMAAHPMDLDDVLQLGLDMAKALLLCERHRIVHRDIKPQNIFISLGGDFKLGDFGVARELEQTTSNLSRKGTYNYMAPEVFHGRPGNAAVDIYSLGIVLYTLLNGNRAPFLQPPPAEFPSAREREAAQQKRLSGEALPPLPGVPAALNELVLKMCAFEPKERFQNARELAEAMEGVAYELRGEKTVSLFTWAGWNTQKVAGLNEITEVDDGSRWLDGTPVVVEKEAEPVAETEPPAPKKFHGKALVAVLTGMVVVLAGVAAWVVAWLAAGNDPRTSDAITTRTTQIQKTQIDWVEEYTSHLQFYFEHKGTLQFSLIDIDNDGAPDIFFKDTNSSMLEVNCSSGANLSYSCGEYPSSIVEVYFSGLEVWRIHLGYGNFGYDGYSDHIYKFSVAINGGTFLEDWKRINWANGKKEYERYNTYFEEQPITAYEFDEAMQKARGYSRVRFEHTYDGGDINLEDYWP